MSPGYEFAVEQMEELEQTLDDAKAELKDAYDLVTDLSGEYFEAQMEVDRAQMRTEVCPVCAAAVDEPCDIDGAPRWTHTARLGAINRKMIA